MTLIAREPATSPARSSSRRVPPPDPRDRPCNDVPSPWLLLEEKRQILDLEHVLVQDDLSPPELPLPIDAVKDILSLPDENVRFRFDPVSVDQEARLDGHLRRRRGRWLHVEDLDVGHHVADPRERLLGPVDAGQDLLHPPRQRLFSLVEPVDVLPPARELPLELAELDVASHRHPVVHVFGQECEPLLVSPLVEKLGLPVKEVLDLLLEEKVCDVIAVIGHAIPAGDPCPGTRLRI